MTMDIFTDLCHSVAIIMLSFMFWRAGKGEIRRYTTVREMVNLHGQAIKITHKTMKELFDIILEYEDAEEANTRGTKETRHARAGAELQRLADIRWPTEGNPSETPERDSEDGARNRKSAGLGSGSQSKTETEGEG